MNYINPLPSGYINYLGEIRLVEVYEFFDFPQLFLGENKPGQKYIFLCTLDDMDDDFIQTRHWLCAPVSSYRLKDIKNNEMQLRDCFLAVEGGYCFNLVDAEGYNCSVSEIASTSIEDDLLPHEGVYLDCSNNAEDERKYFDDAYSKSVATNSSVINLRMRAPSIVGMSIPLKSLGGVMTKLQELVDVITYFQLGNVSIKGPIAKNSLDESELLLAHAFDGSFGAQIISKQKSNLFGSVVDDSIKSLIQLLKVASEEEDLVAVVSSYNERVSSKYLSFLKSLNGYNIDSSIDWVSSDQTSHLSFRLSDSKVLNAINEIESVKDKLSEIIDVRAELTGWTHDTARFSASNSKETYKGKITNSLLSISAQPSIYKMYDMSLEKKVVVSSNGSEKNEYKLISMIKVN